MKQIGSIALLSWMMLIALMLPAPAQELTCISYPTRDQGSHYETWHFRNGCAFAVTAYYTRTDQRGKESQGNHWVPACESSVFTKWVASDTIAWNSMKGTDTGKRCVDGKAISEAGSGGSQAPTPPILFGGQEFGRDAIQTELEALAAAQQKVADDFARQQEQALEERQKLQASEFEAALGELAQTRSKLSHEIDAEEEAAISALRTEVLINQAKVRQQLLAERRRAAEAERRRQEAAARQSHRAGAQSCRQYRYWRETLERFRLGSPEANYNCRELHSDLAERNSPSCTCD